ncbi:hypothetical protein [Pontibacter chinhatensis]|uniref:Lipoprotein n=1 Tax=Pontibacter chinhatensis TaxID=1436961 RepID=A0A1I2S9F6_9BACT|nr:hypothetical protein [Pontibacter chinhatensis]SFG48319.1 hypothetical protein SAMN05421739_102662 [Pontibacter chinhatensis]
MRYLYFILALLLLLSACSPDRKPDGEQQTNSLETEQEGTVAADTTFEQAFNQFFSALQAADTAALNQFLHPKYGLWVIEQPGAVPKMTFVRNISSFKRAFQDRSFLTVKDEVKTCDLQQESWPTFNCADMDYEAGKSGYSKDGCFAAGPGPFVKSGYWNYADLPPAQLKQVEATLPLVQQSVLHTATSFEFHFGFVEGRWYLLFAKLIYPCSA